MRKHYPLNASGVEDAGLLPWTDGVPATGIEGSYPGQALVTDTEAEVLAAAAAAGLVPSSTDLTQLAQAIARGVYVGGFTGSANALAATLPNSLAFPSLLPGMRFKGIALAANTGGVTIALSGFLSVPGPLSLLRRNGTAMKAGDISPSVPFTFEYDGTGYRMVAPTPSEMADVVGIPQVFQTILTQFYATPATYWRMDSPSTAIPAGVSTTIGNYANTTKTVGTGTTVNPATGKVTIGPNDGGTYVLTATNAMDIPTTEESIVIVVERLGAIAISRGPYPAPGNNANDQSTTAVVRLQPGDVIRVDYIQNNPNNSPSNTLNQPLGHFGGVRVGG